MASSLTIQPTMGQKCLEERIAFLSTCELPCPQATECNDRTCRIHAVLGVGHQEVISRTGRIWAYPLPFGYWSIVGLDTHMDFWILPPLIIRDNRMSSLKSRNKRYFNQALCTYFPQHISYFYAFFCLAHEVLRCRVTRLLLAV